MKKNELKNGDIVVTISANIAVVIGEGEDAYLLYQYEGYDVLEDYYDDDLNDIIDDEHIMQVYRSNVGFSGFIGGFECVDNEIPFWERDETWVCPDKKEREEQRRIAKERREAEDKAQMQRWAEERAEAEKHLIFIVVQGYYGNRTGTKIRRENINFFLRGYECPELFPGMDILVDRRIIHVPGSDHVVIVYDQNEEDEYMNEEFPEMLAKHGDWYLQGTGREMTPWVSCRIPEMGIELHSRCFACRMDENGEMQSLEEGDEAFFINYFPEK